MLQQIKTHQSYMIIEMKFLFTCLELRCLVYILRRMSWIYFGSPCMTMEVVIHWYAAINANVLGIVPFKEQSPKNIYREMIIDFA